MKLDIEDMNNKSLRKTLTFKNIPQPQKWGSWDKSKVILTKDIKSVNPTVEETETGDKIERAYRSWENKYNNNLMAISTKFNKWQFTESIKPASSEQNCRHVS